MWAFLFFKRRVEQLRRLFQQYLGGGAWGGGAGAMVDRFVSPSRSRVVDYVAVMTVKLAPQLKADCDELSDLKQAREESVSWMKMALGILIACSFVCGRAMISMPSALQAPFCLRFVYTTACRHRGAAPDIHPLEAPDVPPSPRR